jgi:hypothetical protein
MERVRKIITYLLLAQGMKGGNVKAIEWIKIINRAGFHAEVINGGDRLKLYRPEDKHWQRDKAEPFAVLTLWSYPVTWRPPQ